MVVVESLQEADAEPTAHRPHHLCREPLPGKQLDGDLVPCADAEAALQLQAAGRIVDDAHCLEAPVTIRERGRADGMTLVAPPDRRRPVARGDDGSIEYPGHQCGRSVAIQCGS